MTELGKDNKYIDIERTIRESKSKLLNRIPAFAIKWIVSIIKQEEINHILSKYSEYSGKDFLDKILEEFNVKIVVEGKENLLTGEDFNSIIVCCGMYNDEVCEMLKKSDIGNKEIIKWN